MLYTKCILDPIAVSDGIRISVMSRHTLNDGLIPDRRIIDSMWDLHYRKLAPTPKLVGTYLRGEINWEQYAGSYLRDLTFDPKPDILQQLIELALRRDVTIMCIEPTPERCHRRLLAEECKRLNPDLEILCR